MLIGTGGVSGTIALEALDGNPNNGLDYLETNLGGWSVGFNHFDIEFKQNVIVGSNIAGKLVIPKLKDSEGNKANIQVSGHFNEEGDFNLTAFEKDGFKSFNLFNFVNFNILSIELGKKENKFYIGTSCEIGFENEMMKKMLGDQKIALSGFRIYEDGSMEIAGGGFIPVSFSLDLGPVEVAVTGVHFGSTQQEFNGQMRKYSYWGFDGSISINPSWLDARGEGIKYYYTTDNDEFAGKGDSFLRIQTIEVDMMIPGDVDPDRALAIINGMVSIPEPGESPEYEGKVGLKIPKAKISGGAHMKLQPKETAFIIEAGVELPSPIALGATGLAFYSFGGILGYKYVAEKEAIEGFTSENKWYEYYKHPRRGVNLDKFSAPPKTNEYSAPVALGAGAVLGTIFDDGYTFSMRLMAILSLPSVFILDGRANILGDRMGILDTSEPPFFAFVAVGDGSFEFAIGADYSMPDNGWIIDLYADIRLGFFKNNPSGWYVNFGTKDKPIQASILYDIFNVKAYLMISAKGIEMGARADFNLQGSFIGIEYHFHAYVAVGGQISFEKVQLGGYVSIGGRIYVNVWRIFSLDIKIDLLAGAEATKPFLLYFEFKIDACIRLFWFLKVCARVTIPLKWEISKEIDRDPIPALPNHEATYPDRTLESVKGVHMLTGEVFDLQYEVNSSNRSVPPLNPSEINKIIPLDTFIDIKTMKGLSPGNVRNQIGGHTGGAENFFDLIPPKKVQPGGRQIRQVKHKYSIEKIGLKMWNGTAWVDYHPFEAVVSENDRESVNKLPIGYWQRSGKEYNAIRILGTSPFSYMTAGEPGWFIPEQYGITPSEMFCESESLSPDCITFLNKTIGTRYYRPKGIIGNEINGVYFTLDGFDKESLYTEINYDATTGEVLTEVNERRNFLEITAAENHHKIEQSLQFPNTESMVIILPEPTKMVDLKLTTFAEGVTITYYKTDETSSILEQAYTKIKSVYKTKEETKLPITYESTGQPIAKIIITPKTPVSERAAEIREEMAELLNASYDVAEGEVEMVSLEEEMKYNALEAELNKLVSQGCTTISKPIIEENKDAECFIKKNEYPDESKELTTLIRQVKYFDDHIISFGAFERQTPPYVNTAFIHKLDTSGNSIWCFKTIQNAKFEQVIYCENGDYIVSGIDYSKGFDEQRILILRLDNRGKLIWKKIFYKKEAGSIYIRNMNDDCTFVFMTFYFPFLFKINKEGNIIARQSYHGIGGILAIESGFNEGEIAILHQRSLSHTPQNSPIFLMTLNQDLKVLKNLQFNLKKGDFSEGFSITPTTFSFKRLQEFYVIVGIIGKRKVYIKYPRETTDTTNFKMKIGPTQKISVNGADNYVITDNFIAERRGRESIKNGVINQLDLNFETKTSYQLTKDNQVYSDFYIKDYGANKFYISSKNSFGAIDIESEDCCVKIEKSTVNLDISETSFSTTEATDNIGPPTEGKEIDLDKDYFVEASIGMQQIQLTITTECLKVITLTEDIKICHTSLQQVCWLTQEKWDYNETIPELEAMKSEQEAMEASVEATAQPIWRPNTSYYLHFQLKDEVDNGKHEGKFDYYYAFKTAGPLGHFHNAKGVTYGNEYDEKDTILNRKDKNGQLSLNGRLTNPDNYPITSLRQYIDYRKSYPNANGNLLKAKPLFYGAHQAKLSLFFSQPFVKHMLSDWEKYNSVEGPKGGIHLAIKDPITNSIIPYPLPENFSEETVPITETFATWVEFSSPEELKHPPETLTLLDAEGLSLGDFKILKWEFRLSINTYRVRIDDQAKLAEQQEIKIQEVQWKNPSATENLISLPVSAYGKEDATWNDDNDPTIPLSIRTFNNWIDFIHKHFDQIQCELYIGDPLKPKSYTYSVSLTNLKPRKLYTVLVYNAFEVQRGKPLVSEQIHEYVFKTSRYQSFEEQVKSYQLTDEEGASREAIFTIEIPLSIEEVTTLLDTVSSENTDEQNFDKLMENTLGMIPLDPPVSTEFNVIKNSNTDEVVAVLIRNPEPFNNPKIPIEFAKDMIRITGEDSDAYSVLYAKDYASALITHSKGIITRESLDFIFTYYSWNGKAYVTQDEVTVKNILITNN